MLRDISFTVKPGSFVAVVGGTGTGKSSLVNEVLYKALGAELNRTKARPGKHQGGE